MRLIDADMLKEKFENMVETPTDKAIYLVAKHMIDSQPTAYDINAVVEELRHNSWCLGDYGVEEHYCIDLQDAVDIVKRGGLDD